MNTSQYSVILQEMHIFWLKSFRQVNRIHFTYNDHSLISVDVWFSSAHILGTDSYVLEPRAGQTQQ